MEDDEKTLSDGWWIAFGKSMQRADVRVLSDFVDAVRRAGGIDRLRAVVLRHCARLTPDEALAFVTAYGKTADSDRDEKGTV